MPWTRAHFGLVTRCGGRITGFDDGVIFLRSKGWEGCGRAIGGPGMAVIPEVLRGFGGIFTGNWVVMDGTTGTGTGWRVRGILGLSEKTGFYSG